MVNENNLTSLVKRLIEIVGERYVVSADEDLLVYEYDGSVDKSIPVVVVLPGSPEEVSQIVLAGNEFQMPIIARGAGTGLSGGSIARQGGIVIALTRLNRILEINEQDR